MNKQIFHPIVSRQLLKAMCLFYVSILLLTGCAPSENKNQEKEPISNTSASVLDQVLEAGIIRVGTTGDFSPFSYQLTSESDIYQGIDIALARDLGDALGVEVAFVKTTWPTMMEDLKNNRFDIGMSGITINLTRQKNAFFSIPLLSSGKAAITRDENVSRYTTIDAINQSGVRVIVNPGGTNETFARKNFPLATIVQNDNNLSIFQKIVDGEADVMVTDATETLVQQLIHPELEAVNPDSPFNFFEMGYLLPRDPVFKAYIDQWINLRQKEGAYQKVFDAELKKIAGRTE